MCLSFFLFFFSPPSTFLSLYFLPLSFFFFFFLFLFLPSPFSFFFFSTS